ncbi:MAG: hypothetical protein KGL39_44470 [Patescibacteria group bacterium]|nr:hypothetical protein [Patescibacteria group bacterium]
METTQCKTDGVIASSSATCYAATVTMTEFEAKIFRRFARNHKPPYADRPIQLEGDGQIAVCAAAHRLARKGVLKKYWACAWFLTDLGKQMAVEWQRHNVEVSRAAPPAASDKPTAQRGGVVLH